MVKHIRRISQGGRSKKKPAEGGNSGYGRGELRINGKRVGTGARRTRIEPGAITKYMLRFVVGRSSLE